jgi:hypothetical protein
VIAALRSCFTLKASEWWRASPDPHLGSTLSKAQEPGRGGIGEGYIRLQHSYANIGFSEPDGLSGHAAFMYPVSNGVESICFHGGGLWEQCPRGVLDSMSNEDVVDCWSHDPLN